MNTYNVVVFISTTVCIDAESADDAIKKLTHSHPLRSGILALCNKRWLEVFLRKDASQYESVPNPFYDPDAGGTDSGS